MATPVVDPIDASFTPERLAYYRDLHARYPLWCGDWPLPEKYTPEALLWLKTTRLGIEAKLNVPKAEHAWIEFDWPEPRWSNVPRPTLRIVEEDTSSKKLSQRAISPVEPPAGRALFSAVEYTFAKWHSGVGPGGTGDPCIIEDDEPLLEYWKNRFSEIMERPDLSPYMQMEPAEPSKILLMLIRQAYLSTPRTEKKQRAKLRRRLHQYWKWIGEDIGVIPQVQGGRSTTLPISVLTEIVDETVSLMAGVGEHTLQECELQEVRTLLTGRQIPDAERRRIDTNFETNSWAMRLKFPMLTEREIRILRGTRGADSPGVASAARFLEDSERLPYRSSTIENLVSSSRSS